MTTGSEHRVPLQGAESQVSVVAESAEDGSYEIRVERGTTGEYDLSTTPPTSGRPGPAHGESALPGDGGGVSARAMAAGLGVAALLIAAVALAFRGGDEPEVETPDVSPAALETPVREFQVFQIREPGQPTLRSFAITRDVGVAGDDVSDDAVGALSPDAEGVEDDEPPIEPGDDPAGDEQPALDPLTVDRLRNVRIELQPEDPIRAPDDALAEEYRSMDLVLPDGTDDDEESPRDDE